MLTLAINTASRETAIALIENFVVMGEETWVSNADESERLLPALKNLLRASQKEWSDLDRLVVVNGPGSYTSLRIGVTVANALAWRLKIPMHAVDVFTLWEHRIAPQDRTRPHRIAIAAGKAFWHMAGDAARYTEAELLALGEPIYGEFPSALKVDFSCGKALASLDFPPEKAQKEVAPLYLNPPHITVPRPAQDIDKLDDGIIIKKQ